MIHYTAFSIIVTVLIASCAALEEQTENATVTTTTEYASIQIAEANIQEIPDTTFTEPVIERSSHFHHVHPHEPTYHGFWKKKFVWRPRWVKTWQERKVYVAVWKRMWGPAMLNEWVPIPKPPPGWVKPGVGTYVAQKYPH